MGKPEAPILILGTSIAFWIPPFTLILCCTWTSFFQNQNEPTKILSVPSLHLSVPSNKAIIHAILKVAIVSFTVLYIYFTRYDLTGCQTRRHFVWIFSTDLSSWARLIVFQMQICVQEAALSNISVLYQKSVQGKEVY